MNQRRRLVLRREELTDLAGHELLAIAGGTHIFSDCGCLTHGYSCDQCPIPSLPVNTCTCDSNIICRTEG